MADIRIVRPRPSRVWVWTGLLAAAALLVWGSTLIFGDRTSPEAQPRIGAAANFGAERAPVLPAQTASFESLVPLQDRDLGRLVQIRAVAESGVRDRAVWVRTEGGRRILLRFEPAPDSGSVEATAIRRIGAGTPIRVDGYLDRISRAELEVLLDSLGVALPRPPPGRKFGDLPDPEFMKADSLFIRTYYISVRPEALRPPQGAN